MCTFPSTSPIILEALDVTVGLQWGEEDIEEPQADEQHGGQNFWCPGPAQLSTDLWPPSVHQCGNTYEGKDGKECDGERQCAWIHLEITALGVMVDGGDGPCHLSDISKASQNYMKVTHRTDHNMTDVAMVWIFTAKTYAGLTPMPRNTFTALDPVTLPMEASAYWSWMAATLLAKVSGQTEERRASRFAVLNRYFLESAWQYHPAVLHFSYVRLCDRRGSSLGATFSALKPLIV